VKTPGEFLNRSVLKKKILLWGFFLPALLCAGAATVMVLKAVTASPTAFASYEEVRAEYTGSDAVLLDRQHKVIHEMRIDPHGRRLDWSNLSEISIAVQSTVLQAEDRRFYDHHGVDWIALGSAFGNLLGSSNPRGASTISMQLASKLDEDLQPRDRHRSLTQKLRQVRAALELEREWSKPEILEAYLNLVTFRGELQGITAAAAGLFAKKPHGLDRVEALILAALIRSPNAGADAVASRAGLLAESMNVAVDDSEILQRARQVLTRPYSIEPQADWAPHVAKKLLNVEENGPVHRQISTVSTLDGELQRFAFDALRHHLQDVAAQNVNDGAVLVVANRTGEVLAYVGNNGDRSSARYVDGIAARRQAGSTLKPFVYGVAFERRLITPVSLIDDSPLNIPVPGGMYRPDNYDNRFHGPVTARTALASSLNVPAVKVLELVGIEYCVERLRDWGFTDLQDADYYGPSLALGSADISLWELVNAYRAIANKGVWSPLRMDFSETSGPSVRVLSPEAAFLVADILSDRESRSITFSLESPLATRFWSAVKTGTSKDMRDNWCVGFSEKYTVGVWAGNFSGESMWDVSGITGAAPVWVEVMNWLHRENSGTSPVPPPGVMARSVKMLQSGKALKEWFIRGTETPVVEIATGVGHCTIASPVSGTVIALDPDIPPDRQKIFFEALPEGNSMRWVLDGQALGPAAAITLWTPVRGEHTLALVSGSDDIVDTVNFEVRGSLAGNAGKSSGLFKMD
jgi:penicillin-binding protein 1C